MPYKLHHRSPFPQPDDKLALLVGAVLVVSFTTIAILAYFVGIIAFLLLFLLFLFLQVMALAFRFTFAENFQDSIYHPWVLPALYGILLLMLFGAGIFPIEFLNGGVVFSVVLFFVGASYYPIRWLIQHIKPPHAVVVPAQIIVERQVEYRQLAAGCTPAPSAETEVASPLATTEPSASVAPDKLPPTVATSEIDYKSAGVLSSADNTSSTVTPDATHPIATPSTTDDDAIASLPVNAVLSGQDQLGPLSVEPETALTNDQIIERELKSYCRDTEEMTAMRIVVEGRLKGLNTTQIFINLTDAEIIMSESTLNNTLIPTLKTLGLVQDPKRPHLFKLKIL